jgi:hypothetical protein
LLFSRINTVVVNGWPTAMIRVDDDGDGDDGR